ncbi:hypothetical protein [uncultured Akkermansia sp.]|uniref:hypothetical protein n=1 Tax=Akkermansia sp. TaxID=1872421 RepID=UPI0025E9284C|nr:hypothetical protein [uncultured Akkermansia sp.]
MELSADQYREIQILLDDRLWRLNHLYWIIDKDARKQRFRMNWAQEELYRDLHYRNDILKVRQLGISTFVAIFELDAALFIPDITCGVIDRTRPEAEKKMDKMQFAFRHLDYLPPHPTDEDKLIALIGGMIKEQMEGTTFTKSDITFPNNSTVYAGTSLRGGTLQVLHISELGSIAAHDPKKASEIMTGGFNTVAKNGIIIKESTHEGGQYGLNYSLTVAAMDMVGKPLSKLDFRFFFFSWIEQDEYRLEGCRPSADPEMIKYFKSLEKDYNIILDDEQKAWYESMARTQGYLMRQEYPTVPDEALNPIAAGTIFGSQINRLRELGRLTSEFEANVFAPVYAAWDIGVADFMSIWLIQPGQDGKFYLLDNITANGQTLDWYVGELRKREARDGYHIRDCLLPHDCQNHVPAGTSFFASLERAGFSCERITRTKDRWASVDATRRLLRYAVIHARCSEKTYVPGMKEGYLSGVSALSNYKTAPPGTNGTLKTEPMHDVCSHASDALRTFSEAWEAGLISKETGWRDDELEEGDRRPKGLAKGTDCLW